MGEENSEEVSEGSTPTRRNMLRAAAGVGAGALVIPGVAAADPTGEEVGGVELGDLEDRLPFSVPWGMEIGFTAYKNPCSFEIEISMRNQTRRDTFTCDPDGRTCENATLNIGVAKLTTHTCYKTVNSIRTVENELTYCTRSVSWSGISWDCTTVDTGSEEIS